MKTRKNTFERIFVIKDDDILGERYHLCQGGRLGVFDEICCEVKLAHEHGQNLFCYDYNWYQVMTKKHISCDLDETVIQGSKGGGSEQNGL